MPRGLGRDFVGHTSQSFLNELTQRPARAVSGKHRQIMDMEIGVSVGLGNGFGIDILEPVVGRNGAGIVENESPQ